MLACGSGEPDPKKTVRCQASPKHPAVNSTDPALQGDSVTFLTVIDRCCNRHSHAVFETSRIRDFDLPSHCIGGGRYVR